MIFYAYTLDILELFIISKHSFLMHLLKITFSYYRKTKYCNVSIFFYNIVQP